MQGFLGGVFQRLDRMFLRQRQQAVQDPDANGAALLDHPFGPTAGVRANQPGAIQQISLAVFDDAPIRGMQMVPIRGELPRFDPHMDGDDFPPLVEHAHQPGLPARPDLAAHILRRHRIIRPLQLDVAVLMHGARSFLEHREQARRQRREFGPFHFVEHLAHLLPRGAVDARVGHAAFPFGEKQVLFGQTIEAAALERVVLGELHARLDLALVLRHRRARRQHGRAVVPAKLRHLRIEFGIIPVRPRHGGAQVVNHQRLGHPAKITERIFQAPDEALGRLPPHHFAVSLPGMAQDHPKQMRPLALAVHQHPCAQTKIHLRFRPGSTSIRTNGTGWVWRNCRTNRCTE